MSSTENRKGLLVPGLQAQPFEVRAVRPSPCTVACPAGINVKAYVSLIAEGRFAQALEVVRERCPLPGICGRICHHPCETVCRRGDTDQPVAIRALKRFVADLELELPSPPPVPPADKAERVAIIGSGPAGLTAAYDLRRAGYPVTVFEAESKPGGMLRYGIADYRLPVDVLDTEIAVLERAGVEIETGRRIGRDLTLEELLAQGWSAAVLAVGAQRGSRLRLDGQTECDEVEDALAFLRRVNRGERTPIDGRVLVIGGGSTAIEAARAARRLGAGTVEIVYRRQRAEMPADEEEIDSATAEGIEFRFLTAPSGVTTRNGKLVSLECLEVALGEPDASGRRRPIPLTGSEFSLAADRVFAAVGQEAELDFLPVDLSSRLAERGRLTVDPSTSMTALRGVFGAGDVVDGSSTVIDAIAAGHRVAEAVIGFLERGTGIEERRAPRSGTTEVEIPLPAPPPLARHRPIRDEIRIGDEFAEIERAFSAVEAMAEARRCLRCGPCSECLVCASSCGRRHLSVQAVEGDREAAPLLLRAPVSVVAGLPDRGEVPGRTAGWLLRDLAAGALVDTGLDCPVALTPAHVTIDPDHCRGCARCLEVCSFDALHLIDPAAPETTVDVDTVACRGCNLCAGVCPTDAIAPVATASGWWGTSLDELYPRLAAAPDDAPTVVLACQRRAATIERSLAPAGSMGRRALLVPVRCSGQVQAGRLLELYRHGAGAVVVAGCLSGSCRYGHGTGLAERQLQMAIEALDAMGFDGGAISGDWKSDQEEGLDPVSWGDLVAPAAASPWTADEGKARV